jgi:hypothetical protein
MYPPLLGKFVVPEAGTRLMPSEGWVAGVRYQAEPPIVVKGGLNPWADERQREVYTAEEAAWKQIVPLQAEYVGLVHRQDVLITEIQHWLRDIEVLTGKKSGLSDASNYATLLYSLSGGPYAWAAALAKFGVDFVLGIGKKKQLKSIMSKLEALAAQVAVVQARMQVVADAVVRLIQTGEAIRAGQLVKITQDVAQSEQLYQDRQGLERLRASVLKEKNRQAALMPTRQGGNDAL